uniref:Uncharacterized protein n=1 Tax=Arundo donax TaxID=35708 RepID=A0A0A9ES48_ARUDO
MKALCCLCEAFSRNINTDNLFKCC